MVPLPKCLNKASAKDVKNFLSSFDTILSDCDGVLWIDKKVIENSEKVMNKFLDMKKTLFYVTNNNSLTREEYAEKCQKLGFKASEENIVCTSYLAAEYLRNINFKKKVYVIGNKGIAKELDRAGILHSNIGPDIIETDLPNYVETKLNYDPDVGCVLVGFDAHFSYPKLLKATSYLKNPNCLFLATCSDETFPACANDKFVFPGTGAFVKCLETASGRKALVLGKPNDYIKNAVMKMHKMFPEKTLMIGDRCNTDILFGNKCGFQTLLVFSGVSSMADVENYAKSCDSNINALVPQYCINKLGDLLPYMLD